MYCAIDPLMPSIADMLVVAGVIYFVCAILPHVDRSKVRRRIMSALERLRPGMDTTEVPASV